MAHLWVGNPLPVEFLSLKFCRDIYHCTPPQLRMVPLADVLAHMTCINAENEVKNTEESANN